MTVVVVELTTDAGITGIGESVCLQSPAEAFKQIIDATKPLIVGEDPCCVERIARKIEGFGGWLFGRHFAGYALGSIDMALWDIIGKASNQPLYNLLGGKIRDSSACFKYLHHDDPQIMALEAADAIAQGYDTIYCKYTEIEHLKQALAAIREKIGMAPQLWVDFNQTLSPGYAVQFLKEAEEYRIDIVEQPVLATNLEGMAQVRGSTAARVLAHESSWTLYETLNVIKHEAADIISVEPRMTWGILATKKAAGIAEAAGLPVIMHSAAELGVATAAFLHVIASTPNFILANQCMYDWFEDDYIQGGKLPFERGRLRAPDGPGLGVELDAEKVAEYHEQYRQVGTYSIFGDVDRTAQADRVPLWPSY